MTGFEFGFRADRLGLDDDSSRRLADRDRELEEHLQVVARRVSNRDSALNVAAGSYFLSGYARDDYVHGDFPPEIGGASGAALLAPDGGLYRAEAGLTVNPDVTSTLTARLRSGTAVSSTGGAVWASQTIPNSPAGVEVSLSVSTDIALDKDEMVWLTLTSSGQFDLLGGTYLALRRVR